MCGRYLTAMDVKEMEEICAIVQRIYGDENVNTGEIFPTNNAPMFIAEENSITTTLMTWGMPQYKSPGVIINARAETAPEKRTFSSALETRRCIIPSTGFFEWAKIPDIKKKDKFLFHLPDSQMLYMAGLYNIYEDGYPRFVVLTTAANNSMRDIHDRMPVILHKHELHDWFHDSQITKDILCRVPPELSKMKVG